MTTMTTLRPSAPPVPEPRVPELRVRIGPNWFASVMGTGIVANAAATLPLQFPGLRAVATVVWLGAVVLLVGVTVAWVRHGRVHADNPIMAPFWGALPMAVMTVGGGTLLLGRDWIGLSAAIRIDLVLWTLGTVLGLITAVAIPYLMITRHRITADAAFGGWLMPVVPPMVSAANGALLIPHLAGGQLRLTMLIACYAMFGFSLAATIIIVTLLGARLVRHGVGEARMVPTLWIVLGPLGQAITAAHLLGVAAPSALPARYAADAGTFALVFGIPTWGFAMLWLALVASITIRTARVGLPFALTWWSFTFPVGTMVTGTTALAARTHSDLFVALAVALYALLVTAWITVATRTARAAHAGTVR